MKTNEEFNDRDIVKELKVIGNKLESIFELINDYIELITTKPEDPLTKEKAEKDFSELKKKLSFFGKKKKSEDEG